MSKHIYIFGSICRGEYDFGSDVDLLVCTEDVSSQYGKDSFSVYTHSRIEGMWARGEPFAWHLHLESRLVYSSDGVDWMKGLGAPGRYANALADCLKFKSLFQSAATELSCQGRNVTFELSCIYLAIRNFATCYSIWAGAPTFSRRAPFESKTGFRMSLSLFKELEAARILSTRGIGNLPTDDTALAVLGCRQEIDAWMEKLLLEVSAHECV